MIFRAIPVLLHRAAHSGRLIIASVFAATLACVPMTATAANEPAITPMAISAIEKKLEALEQTEKNRTIEIKALEDKLGLTKDLADARKDITANAQQTVNWWLAFLAVFLAVAGLAIPIFFTRELRAKYEAATQEVSAAKDAIAEVKTTVETERGDIVKLKSEVQKHLDESKELLSQVRENKSQSDVALSATQNNAKQLRQSDALSPTASLEDKLAQTALAERVAADPNAKDSDKLFAQGVKAFSKGEFATAATRFEAVAALDPTSYKALTNWGGALGQLADMAQGNERYRLLNDAISQYEAAVKVKPDNHEALYNWGVALNQLAEAAEGEERARLLNAAISQYEAAVKIKPDKHDALYNWGATLGMLTNAAEGEERARLLNAAISQYEAAVNIKPDKHGALNNWGNALDKLANAAKGEERARLLNAAISKYEAALKIKPDLHEALTNWGTTLLKLAHDEVHLATATALLDKAEIVLARARDLGGYVSYHLVCVAAMRGNAGRFVEHANGLAPDQLQEIDHLLKDAGLDRIRDAPEFVAWWKKCFADEPTR
jgi:tetratricopeptide (TPR) repeat protein